jgi:hypothetical protein
MDCDIRTVQEMLNLADVSTMMIDIHVGQNGVASVRSPLDALPSPNPSPRPLAARQTDEVAAESGKEATPERGPENRGRMAGSGPSAP